MSYVQIHARRLISICPTYDYAGEESALLSLDMSDFHVGHALTTLADTMGKEKFYKWLAHRDYTAQLCAKEAA